MAASFQDRLLNFYVIILFIIFSLLVYKSTRSVCLSVGRAAKEYLIYTFFVFIILTTYHLLYNYRLSNHVFCAPRYWGVVILVFQEHGFKQKHKHIYLGIKIKHSHKIKNKI